MVQSPLWSIVCSPDFAVVVGALIGRCINQIIPFGFGFNVRLNAFVVDLFENIGLTHVFGESIIHSPYQVIPYFQS